MRPVHIAFLLLINVIWGCNFVAMAFAVEHFQPFLTNALRFGALLIVCIPFLRWVHGRMRLVLLNAFLLGFLHFAFALYAIKLAGDVSVVAVATQLNVPFATLLAIFLLGESIGWKRALGITLSFGGVAILSFDDRVFQYLDAVMYTVLAAFAYSIITILTRQLSGVPALTIQAWAAVAGVVGSLAMSLLFESDHIALVQTADMKAWGGILYSGLMSSLIGHGGVTWLLGRYEVSAVSPYYLTAPVFAVTASILILGESLSVTMIIGALLTLAGVAVVTFRNVARSKDRMMPKEAPAS